MAEQSLKVIIQKLDGMFGQFNDKFFAGQVQKPIITVSPDTTKGAYGWCTSWKAWKSTVEEAAKSDGYYEINLCAEHLARPFSEISATLIHEMVHLLNLQNGVQDTSRGGTYHNKRFKQTAEEHGLIIEQHPKYGWTITSLNEEAKKFIDGLGEKNFEIYRSKALKLKGSKSSSSRKYTCPSCGLIVRATKEVHVLCGDCNVELEE